MFELSQSQLIKAVDILRSGPMKADVFASRMWPDRLEKYRPGDAGRAGHLVLRRMGALGLVEKIGDLWVTRGFSQSVPVPTRVATQVALGEPFGETPREPLGVPPREPLQVGHEEVHAERQRLGHLVALADAPAAGVTHDVVFGNIRVRGVPLDDCLVEACAFAVLRGRSLNVYPLLGAMIVGLTPVEGARALYLRWRQSGVPPEPPYRGGTRWFTLDDGIVASPGSWKPEGADRQWRAPESFIDRVARQRAAAGLGPPVGR